MKNLYILLFIFLLSGCDNNLSEEQLAQIELLKNESSQIQKEIALSENELSKYKTGLISSILNAKTQILKINYSLIEQKILAIESGAKSVIQVNTTHPDIIKAEKMASEIETITNQLNELEEKSKNAGGLIKAMLDASIATYKQSIALLQQQYLISKYGLPYPYFNSVSDQKALDNNESHKNNLSLSNDKIVKEKSIKDEILTITVSNKKIIKLDYSKNIVFDAKFSAVGLDKPARAIKGSIVFTDLFGEEKLIVGYTINKNLKQGDQFSETGMGFDYNQFKSSHDWIINTKTEDMKFVFRVEKLLYEDGTTKDVEN